MDLRGACVGGNKVGVGNLVASLCRLAVTGTLFGGKHRRQGIIFSHFCEGGPFGNNCAVITKLRRLRRFMRGFHFSRRSVGCLRDLQVFCPTFLSCLGSFHFGKSVCTMPRNAMIFPNRPLLHFRNAAARTVLLRANLSVVVGRRDLVTAGTQHIHAITPGSTLVRFNLHHTRKRSTKL